MTDLSAIYEFTSIEKIILNNNQKFKNLAPVVKSMTCLKSVELKKTGVSPIVFKEVSDKTPEVSIEFEPLWDANGLDVDGNRYFNGRDFEGYDSKGFLESGLHRNGSYFDDSHLTMTGERYYLGWDYEGYDLRGFLPSGLHRNGTYFGSDHLTLDGLRYYNGLDYQNNPPPAPPGDDNRSVLFTDYYAAQSHVSKLTNSSGVCYLNAAMQVAFKMRAFNDYLIRPENMQLLNQSPLLQEYFMSMDMMKQNLTNSLENFTHLQADSFNDGFTIFSNILVDIVSRQVPEFEKYLVQLSMHKQDLVAENIETILTRRLSHLGPNQFPKFVLILVQNDLRPFGHLNVDGKIIEKNLKIGQADLGPEGKNQFYHLTSFQTSVYESSHTPSVFAGFNHSTAFVRDAGTWKYVNDSTIGTRTESQIRNALDGHSRQENSDRPPDHFVTPGALLYELVELNQ